MVRRWSLKELLKGLPPNFEEEYHEEPIWQLAFNQKKKLLLTSSADQSFSLLRDTDKSLVKVWQSRLEDDTPTAIDWLCDNRFASGYRLKNRVGVFDTIEGELGWEYNF